MQEKQDPADVLSNIYERLGCEEPSEQAVMVYAGATILGCLIREPETVGAFAGRFAEFCKGEWADLMPDEAECAFVLESMREFLTCQ